MTSTCIVDFVSMTSAFFEQTLTCFGNSQYSSTANMSQAIKLQTNDPETTIRGRKERLLTAK